MLTELTYYVFLPHWLYHWLCRKLGDTTDAADLAHDTFIKLLNKPRAIDNIPAACAYLRTVAERIYIDHWRRKSIEIAWLENRESRDATDTNCSARGD